MPTRSANFAYIRFAALFLGLTALVVPQISMAALVAHWTGDDTVVDMTGNGHNGTLVGGATYGPGQINNAFALNGTSALVTVPDDVAWTNTLAGDFSISLWANLTEPASGSIINPDSSFVAQDIGGGPQPKWGLLAGGNLVAFHINGLGTGGPFFAQTPYAPARDGTEWTHLTVVRKAEAGGNRYSIYLNSILGASQLDGSFIAIPDVAADLIIGEAETFYTSGFLDDIRIYDHPLSESEIQSLYNAGVIPIPAALPLFVSALCALAGIQLRKRFNSGD